MPLTAAEKATKRYRECLANGAEPPQPRTSVNAALLDAVRAEIAAGSEHVQAFTASGAKRVKQNTEVNDAAPVLEEEPARAIEAPSDAAGRTRLWQLVWQLEALTGCVDPFSSFVREKLDLEQRVVSGALLRGPWMLLDMQRQARLQRNELCKTVPSSADTLALENVLRRKHEAIEIYRAEFDESKACSQQVIAQLQLAALEVRSQREAARRERDGLSYHDGYQKAKKEYKNAYMCATGQPLIRAGWLSECRRWAALTKDYEERNDLFNSSVSLRWSAPYGAGAAL